MKKLLIAFLIISYITLAAAVYYLFRSNQMASGLLASQQSMQAPNKKDIPLPPDAVKISECVPYMGEHWVQPQNIPGGPYYVVYQGKVVSLEYMFKEEDIPGEKVAKLSFPDYIKYLKDNNYTLAEAIKVNDRAYSLLKGYEYDSVHIAWTAPHAGFTVPHIDMHIYLIPEAELDNVCPNMTLEQLDSPEVIKTLKEKNIPYPGQ